MKTSEFSKYVSLSLKLILFLSIFNSIYNGYWHLMSANILLFVLLFVPQIIKKKYQIKIPIEFEVLLFLFVLSTFLIGKIKWIVSPIFFGTAMGLIAFLILLILYSTNQIKKNYFLIIFFSFNFAVAFGFVIELAKYYLKVLLGQEIVLGIYEFTMVNMTYVMIGALVSSVIGYLYMKDKLKIIGKLVDRFKKVNPHFFVGDSKLEEIFELIKKGENDKTEFKSTLRKNIHTNEIDRKIEYATLKTIAGFMNTRGGTLLIGVEDNGNIIGIEKDGFENNDKFQLHFTNLVREKIGKQHSDLINFQTISVKNKTILKVDCIESKEPIFLKNLSGDEEFYIRSGPSSIQVSGRELIKYIDRKFRKNN